MAVGALLLGWLLVVWAGRLTYPFDLEWMEGGMLAHAWRLEQGQQLYVRPNLEFVPYVYPPGYSALVALLGEVFGLSMGLGRAVSVLAILAAAGTLGWAVARGGAPRVLIVTAPIVFLGTYPMAGAFYDLVRPDSLAVALLGGSLALSLDEERRWAPAAAGLLLAAAFLTKQNTAVYGVPVLLALLQRDRRAAAQFALASVGPALLSIALLQWWSSGNFWRWLAEVPRSHPAVWARATADVPIEWGTALPLGFAVVGFAWVLDGLRGPWPRLVASGVPIWLGMVAVAWGVREVPKGVAPFPAAFAFWGAVAGLAALALLAIGLVGERIRAAAGDGELRATWLPPWWWTWEVGLLLAGGASALMMRVHDSGWINVHAPLFWALTLVAARILARWWADARWRPVVSGALTLQLLWALANLDRAALVPTEADVAAGNRFVAEIAKVEGPVLSPFAAWLPTYAGKPPSVHAMGLWDANYVGGPYVEDLPLFDQALATHYWGAILGGHQAMLGEFVRHYDPAKELLTERDPALAPKTGYAARPWRILLPKREAPPPR